MAARRDLFAAGAPIALAFVSLSIWLHHLGLTHARDYDEGVYWESLRAMHAGGVLFRTIYSSQPPLFLLSAYPMFVAFGASLFSARLSCVFFALAGLGGAYLVGRAVAGTWGGAVAMFLTLTSAAYLAMAQTLQAEASSIGMSSLAVGIALVARGSAKARRAILMGLAGAAFAIGLSCKLLVAGAIVPIVVGFLMPATVRDEPPTLRAKPAPARVSYGDAIIFCIAFAVIATIGIVPFIGDRSAAWEQIVLLHAGSSHVNASSIVANLATVAAFLAAPVSLVAIAGGVAGMRAHDRHFVVMVSWLIATIGVLALVEPLFPHHLVALVPPCVGIATLGVAPFVEAAKKRVGVRRFATVLAVVVAIVLGIGPATYLTRDARLEAIPDTIAMHQTVAALDRWTLPGHAIVTDDQFAAALADRDPPSWLVDTSFARIRSGQLTTSLAIAAAYAPNVDGVLASTGRLATLPGFRSNVERRFALRAAFGQGRYLWTRSTP